MEGPRRAETNWAAREGQHQQHEPLPRQPALLMLMLTVWVEARWRILVPRDPLISPPTHPISISMLPIHIRVEQYWPKHQKASLFQLLSLCFSLIYLYPSFFSSPANFNFSKFHRDQIKLEKEKKKERSSRKDSAFSLPASGPTLPL